MVPYLGTRAMRRWIMKDAAAEGRREAFQASLSAAFLLGFAGIAAALLLVFMTSIPFCTLGVPQLPTIRSGALFHPRRDDLAVHIAREGHAWIGQSITTVDLRSAIEAELATGRYARIVVEADRRVTLAMLQPLFGAAQKYRVPVVLASETVSVLEQTRLESSPRF